MTLAELRFHIHPDKGNWIPVTPAEADAADKTRAYVRFELRPVAPGETYRVRHPGGHLTEELRAFPAEQTHKIVQILHHPDGTEHEVLYYGGPDGVPIDHFPGVTNA